MTTSPGADAVHRWAAFGASVRGSAHVREALPNQDAVSCACDDAGRWAVAAVADGHGHALAVRADTGSHLAVDIAVEAARSCWESLVSAGAAGEVAEHLPSAVASAWLESVQRDLDQRPFSPTELAASGNATALGAHPEVAYGTTLIVSIAAGSAIVSCQIGDGDVLGVRSDGAVFRPLPVDKRLVGTRTTSLASRTAFSDFRSGQVDLRREPIEVVVAATDGYVNSFSADDGFAAAGRDLWKLIRENGPKSVEGALAGWLESTSTDGTGDDATLAILFDEARLKEAPAPTSAATISESSGR